MKKIFLFLVRVFLFFILFFLTGRLFFLIFNHGKIVNSSVHDILLSNLYALPLDISTICYFLLVLFYVILAGIFFNQLQIRRIINWFITGIIVLCAFINIVDSGLVSTWGTKITTKSLSYLSSPGLLKEAFLSVHYLVLLLFFILHSVVFIYIYFRYIKIRGNYTVTYQKMMLFAPLLFLLLTGIRGGWGLNPIGKSSFIFTENPTLSAATVNGFWNIINLFENRIRKDQDYQYFDLRAAERIAKQSSEAKKDTTISILKTNRPNIVIILTEGFSAENMLSLGGQENIAPCMDSLSKNGILFTRFYANGFRTEQGLVAVLSGFPAQPKFSVQRESGKILKLPLLSKILRHNGYYMSYYYSNDLRYARTNEYLKIGLFSKIFDWGVFKNARNTRSGVYDEYLFNFQIDDCNKNPFPFFSIFQTSSSHEPFDGDFELFSKGNDPADKYKNAIHYTDKCIGDYIRSAKKQAWYANTLFIITADHGSQYPNIRDYNVPLRHQIPLILYGDVIRDEYKGKTFDMPASQIDIAATVLAQMNISSSEFEFSKNLFNPYTNYFAFYDFDNGFGIIDKQNTIVYDHDKNSMLYKSGKANRNDSMLMNKGKAILQILIQRFNDME
jgi:phosphoglycerol transferase MdoB-like AlkP superfamily enzyme